MRDDAAFVVEFHVNFGWTEITRWLMPSSGKAPVIAPNPLATELHEMWGSVFDGNVSLADSLARHEYMMDLRRRRKLEHDTAPVGTGSVRLVERPYCGTARFSSWFDAKRFSERDPLTLTTSETATDHWIDEPFDHRRYLKTSTVAA